MQRRTLNIAMRIALVALSLALADALGACSLLRLDPVTAERRSVISISDEFRNVVVLEPMVWLDAPPYRASKGVRLLMGVYPLVAEDSDYLYFQSPDPIEMRVFENGVPADEQDFPGGLAFAKGFSIVPAATYIDLDPDHKMLVMKHGGDFMLMEGRQWKRNF
jgi:hypothetical protein